MSTLTAPFTRAQYDEAFARECAQTYPIIDTVEASYGYAIDRAALEAVARVLACPIKAHAPNWQHGRVLYAVTRKYLAEHHEAAEVLFLDIGTAKGFSAWCLQRALLDAGSDRHGQVVSVDVIDPLSRQFRNSVADCEFGPTTLRELHRAHWWPEIRTVAFEQSTGLDWLRRHDGRVHLAFIDGKHEGSVVWHEGKTLAEHQQSGDIAMFDDVHLPSVSQAVSILGQNFYHLTYVPLLDHRHYAIGVRR